jgi:hypothetical protein
MNRSFGLEAPVTNKKLMALAVLPMLFIVACSASAARTSLQNDPTNTGVSSNPLTGVDPTMNLFDTVPGSTTTTTTTANNTNISTDVAPISTSTTLAPADATAAACMTTNNAWGNGTTSASQWTCLNNQAANGRVGQDTIMAMATSSLGMMNDCSLAVRSELAQQLPSLNTNDPNAMAQLFKTAKIKLAQCYYRIVNLQQGSMQWSPYQAGVYQYNAGNIWNMMSSFGQ